MAIPLNDVLAKLPASRRARIEEQTVTLLAQLQSLEALRKARSLTQVQVARELGIGQNSVSTVERRADLLVSTLRKYIAAAGGELTLIVKFPGGQQFNLTVFGEPLGMEAGLPMVGIASVNRKSKAKRPQGSASGGCGGKGESDSVAFFSGPAEPLIFAFPAMVVGVGNGDSAPVARFWRVRTIRCRPQPVRCRFVSGPGEQLCRPFHPARPEPKSPCPVYVRKMLRAGAKGYLVKDADDDALLDAVRAVARGEAYLSPSVADAVLTDYRKHVTNPVDLLTSREREVLQLIAEGSTNKDIANQLSLSVYTVEGHRSRLMEKLNLHSTGDLVRFAIRNGFIS